MIYDSGSNNSDHIPLVHTFLLTPKISSAKHDTCRISDRNTTHGGGIKLTLVTIMNAATTISVTLMCHTYAIIVIWVVVV